MTVKNQCRFCGLYDILSEVCSSCQKKIDQRIEYVCPECDEFSDTLDTRELSSGLMLFSCIQCFDLEQLALEDNYWRGMDEGLL